MTIPHFLTSQGGCLIAGSGSEDAFLLGLSG